MVTLLATLAPVLALGVLGTTVKVPFVALGPGPTFNTLGETDVEENGEIVRKPVVEIDGTAVDATSGNLNMTTVAVRNNLTLFDALGLWVSGRQGLVPREDVYPPQKSQEEVKEENSAQFAKSENSAELAALRHLNLPVAVEIRTVAEGGPAAGVLREGDRVLRVGSTPVDSADELQDAVGAAGAGSTVDTPTRLGRRETGSSSRAHRSWCRVPAPRRVCVRPNPAGAELAAAGRSCTRTSRAGNERTTTPAGKSCRRNSPVDPFGNATRPHSCRSERRVAFSSPGRYMRVM